VGALKEEKQAWGLREEAHQASLKMTQEAREGAEAYAHEVEQAYADLLAHFTYHQIQNIGLQEVVRAFEAQRKEIEELCATREQKLTEAEGVLAAKVEALDLLQAECKRLHTEANKLQVGKDFLDKQLASKDSRIDELERANQELTNEMAGVFGEGFKEALAQASCENPGINVSNCDPTSHIVDGKVVPLDLDD